MRKNDMATAAAFEYAKSSGREVDIYDFKQGWEEGYKAALREMQQLEYTVEFREKFPTAREQEYYWDVIIWFINTMNERAYGRVWENPQLEKFDKKLKEGKHKAGLPGVSSGQPTFPGEIKKEKKAAM